MGSFLHGARVKRLGHLRLAASQASARARAEEQERGASPPQKPSWLLLCCDLCCLVGLLGLTLYVSWAYDNFPSGDPGVYHAYALAFWTQPPLFHAFPREYPPLALLPFSLTLFPPAADHYYWVFALWMGGIVCLSYVWFARALSRTRAITYAAYLLSGATGTLLMRFDVLPALFTLAALRLAEGKRYRLAYALLALGVLLKLYPALLVPVLMAHEWREQAPAQSGEEEREWRQRLAAFWRLDAERIRNERAALRMRWRRGRERFPGLEVFLGVTLLGFSVPAILNVAGTASAFTYALSRPIQIESVPASLLWLGTVLGFPVQPNESFVSLNLVGPLDGAMRPLSLLLLVAGLVLVCWRVGNGKLSLGQGFVALLAVVLASNKLLSPQYLLWVLPLVAYVLGFDLLWLTICALTTLIFPFLYETRHPLLLVPTNPAFLPTITLRNALLVTATVLAVRGRRRDALPAPEEAGAAPEELEVAGVARPDGPDDSAARLGDKCSPSRTG